MDHGPEPEFEVWIPAHRDSRVRNALKGEKEPSRWDERIVVHCDGIRTLSHIEVPKD